MEINTLYQKLLKHINDYLKSTNKKGIIIGLSGGIDSALVCALCSKAVGKKNVLSLILPCETSENEIKDAKLVAARFKINRQIIDLTPVYEKFIKILPTADRITKGNLKARLRMLTLYYFANKLNYLVAGTGNKSEISVGYFTKYGDGASDFLPIGDLYKSEVRKLSEFAGIPKRIIEKIPTAGFWKKQTDEKELGITYDKLESMLKTGKLSTKIMNKVIQAKHKLRPPVMFYINDTIKKSSSS
ncbi:MAG: NAD(+) synthase [Elusimicrobia bacterium CG1_02_37_114]|nr:MAG: NAD(+) synthase [Elusimicrobia bacterium CG1_02_37_114]